MWLVYLLARATGWGENDIWNMSYTRGLMYLHAHMLYQGANTRWAVATPDEARELDEQWSRLFSKS